MPVLQLARLAVYGGPYNLSLPLTLFLIMLLPMLPPLGECLNALSITVRSWAHVKGEPRRLVDA